MLKILTIDDERDFVDTIDSFFTPRGYKVFKALNGTDGLEIADRESPDIALVDMKMPGIHGDEVLVRMKDISPKTKVIMITAFEGDVKIRERLMSLGARDCLDKPLSSLKDLEAKIKQVIDSNG